LASATGNASRRIAGLGRTKSRGHFVFVATPERDQREPETS